jgi:hypothetical protein
VPRNRNEEITEPKRDWDPWITKVLVADAKYSVEMYLDHWAMSDTGNNLLDEVPGLMRAYERIPRGYRERFVFEYMEYLHAQKSK